VACYTQAQLHTRHRGAGTGSSGRCVCLEAPLCGLVPVAASSLTAACVSAHTQCCTACCGKLPDTHNCPPHEQHPDCVKHHHAIQDPVVLLPGCCALTWQSGCVSTAQSVGVQVPPTLGASQTARLAIAVGGNQNPVSASRPKHWARTCLTPHHMSTSSWRCAEPSHTCTHGNTHYLCSCRSRWCR
jgi:hypothetical protein